MKIVIEIPEDVKKAFDEATKDDLYGCYYDANSVVGKAIKNGTPLPEGAEILTKEAYSDLCLRASHERKTGKWISEIVEKEDWRGIKRKYFHPNSCSVCHNPSNIGEEYPYCPHCGAKMKGVEE